jgi:hypothetical protein
MIEIDIHGKTCIGCIRKIEHNYIIYVINYKALITNNLYNEESKNYKDL